MPTCNLAKSLCMQLKPLIAGHEHSIDGALQFLKKLRETNIEEDEIVIFDVVSLSASITLDLSRQALQELEEHQWNKQLKSSGVCKLAELCLRIYFKFKGAFCKQLKGTLMWSTISGFVVESVMQKLEKTVLPDVERAMLTIPS